MQGNVGANTVDHGFIQRVTHARERFLTSLAVGDDLGNHGVVIGRHGITAVQVRIHAYAKPTGGMEVVNGAGAGHEGFRVFSVDTALERVAPENDIFLFVAKLLPGAYANLFANQVDAGNHFGYRVFHLDAGVHLDKVEARSEEHTSELQSRGHLVCRLLLEKKKNNNSNII